ncbi:hypothetical protein J7L48_11775, partial [bacterium]|nr:hypothetical protein [bacterium]
VQRTGRHCQFAFRGRFMSTDNAKIEIKRPETINRYQYCANNPIKYIDPDGNDSYPKACFLGSFLMGHSSPSSPETSEKPEKQEVSLKDILIDID